jgi:hypothetical protein
MVSFRGMTVGLAVAAALMLSAPMAHASSLAYEYHIEHPRYGDIGTYSNVVKQVGDETVVETELHIAVKFLGIVMYREDASRVERWRNNRFVAFAGVTVTNGKRFELKGEAQGDNFIVTTPEDTVTVPARVHPSNPWAPAVLNSDLMMSTKTGRIEQVQVSGGGVEPVTFDGKDLRLHRYDIAGRVRDSVWIDEGGVPVAFRVVREGTPVDFVLTHPPHTDTASR